MTGFNLLGNYTPLPASPVETVPNPQLAQFSVDLLTAPSDNYWIRPGGIGAQVQAEDPTWIFYSRAVLSYLIRAEYSATLVIATRLVELAGAVQWADWLPVNVPGGSYRAYGCVVEIPALFGGIYIRNQDGVQPTNHVDGSVLVRGV